MPQICKRTLDESRDGWANIGPGGSIVVTVGASGKLSCGMQPIPSATNARSTAVSDAPGLGQGVPASGVPPLMLSTWSFGRVANTAGFEVLSAGGSALDGAIAAAVAVENDPAIDSVSIGGLPDETGRVSVDASVMLSPSACGAVCAVRGFANPSRIARRVMERTVHILLAGEGAEAFAAEEGFTPHIARMLTDEAAREYRKFLVSRAMAPKPERRGILPAMNVEERYAEASSGKFAGAATEGAERPQKEPMHDTVCILARDRRGTLAGVCTTSGLGFKLAGRVGDSPIIGHGLYVDPEVGGVSATGNGELVMSVCGSFLGVEFMRQGRSPAEALLGVLERIRQKHTIVEAHQVALIAMRADGTWASAALRKGFSHCISTEDGMRLEATGTVAIA